MYFFDSRIRYSETDPEGKLKIESLIDYFQDCCSFQSEDGGVGIDYTREKHCAWLVNFWQIEILRRPRLGEYVRTTTFPYDFRQFLGFRNCVMDTRDGERAAFSNSVWSLIDLERNLPVRVGPEMLQAYPLDPRLEMDYLPRKIHLPSTEPREEEAVPVTAGMLDSNRHVNNGQYVRLALSLMGHEDEIRQVCVEYMRQAKLGDVIVPQVYEGTASDPEKEEFIALCSEADHKPFAIVRIKQASRQTR